MAQNNVDDPVFNQKMYKLGQTMQNFGNFFWTGILLCWLVIPAIMLLVKYVKYLIALNDVKTVSNDEDLNQGALFLWIAIGINVGLSLIGVAVDYLSYLSLAGFILIFLGYMKLEAWAERLSLQRNTPRLLEFKAGLGSIKIGNILTIIFIGIFWIPGGFKKAGIVLMGAFGVSNGPAYGTQNMNMVNQPQININVNNVQSNPQPAYTQQPTPQPAYAPQPAYTQQPTPQPAYAPQPTYTEQPPVPAPQVMICPACGAKRENPNVAFCSSCGQKF